MSTFKKKVQWNINQSLICLMLFTLFIISNLIVYPDNVMAGVSYSHYKSTSTDLWERKAAYLWENINRITKELQDAIHDKAQNPPSNELVKAIGSDKEKSSLVSQHNDLKQNADIHFLPPPDLDPMKQLCRTICDMKPPQQKGIQLTDDIKKLKEEKKELEKTRDQSDYWMKNFTLQKGANAIDESLKKFVDIGKAVFKPDSLAGILGKWMKEYSNWKPTDLRLPDGPFVKKYQKEIDTRFTWEIQRYMPHKEQEWISILDKLHKGAKVSDLSRTEQQEFETIVKRYHRCIREEAEAQLSGRRNNKGTIIKAGVTQKIAEKEKQKIVAQKHDKKVKEIEDNIKKFKALCDKIALLTDWTPVTATPQIHISSAVDRTAATSGDSVKYTYTVTNRGNVPLVNVKVKDNKSPSIPLLRGDANSNGVLEKGETWIYESSQVLTSTSSTPISISNTAEATADGQKGGSASPASATAAVTVSAIMVTVPDVLGLTPAQAKETIKAAKLVVGDINKEESTQHKGLVSRQSPEAGKSIVLGSSVTIWLSKGQKKEVRRLFIDPPTKTTEMEKPVQLRALLWHTDGSEVDVTKKANWTGAEKGIFTPKKPGTYQITATYNDFSGSATVIVREPTWSAIEDKPPLSSADDVDANVPLPPADAYTWYVFCDPQTGEVTYGEHHQPGLRAMVGPFPGPRTAEKWIRDNCPRGRCTTDGRCAKEPARGGKWCVICDKNSGEITFSEHKPDSIRFRVMAGGLLGEPEARLWLEQNCPSQRCTSEGTCATSPAIAPTAADGWYVTCFLPAGKIEIGKKPFNPRTDKEIAGPFLGEPNARWWVDQNCPSWQCDTSGQCRSWGFGELGQEASQSVEVAEARQDTSNKFAEIGDPETLTTLNRAEEFRQENPGRPAWEELLEQRQQQVRNDPEWQMLMEQSTQNARNAAQGLANATGSGSSGSSSSGASSGFDQQQELPYMDKDPYGKYQEYQSDTAKKQVPDKPSSQVGTTSTSGSGGTSSGMSWDECVNKYCSMCGGALNILEVSANEECNKCKQKYLEQIKQCASGNSGGSSSEDGYWKEMKVGPTDSSKLNAGPKVYYAARKYQSNYNNYHYAIGKKEDGGLAGFQIIYGPDTFMGCKRWLINKGYWTEEYWR